MYAEAQYAHQSSPPLILIASTWHNLARRGGKAVPTTLTLSMTRIPSKMAQAVAETIDMLEGRPSLRELMAFSRFN